MKKFITFSIALLSFKMLPAQIISVLQESRDNLVSSVEEGGIGENDYAAAGILEDWRDLLDDYREHREDLNRLEEEIKDISKCSGKSVLVPFQTKDGRIFNLPYIPGEKGENLYLLTDEGITVCMALDAPAYLQDIDGDIVRWIRYYAHRNRSRTERIFSRYTPWEPRIKACFEAEGVPAELSELCLVESGCTYTALSSAGALGMWQIMPSTGRAYGMRIDQIKDDRLDPALSTVTAAKILRNNYRKTGDWTLAAAAYNCGPGKFTRKNQGKPWHQVSPFLPKETQQYIPCLLAVHYVWTYRKELGF